MFEMDRFHKNRVSICLNFVYLWCEYRRLQLEREAVPGCGHRVLRGVAGVRVGKGDIRVRERRGRQKCCGTIRVIGGDGDGTRGSSLQNKLPREEEASGLQDRHRSGAISFPTCFHTMILYLVQLKGRAI